nr:MAG TPA: hypothetical protein [Crassvirales sp.]
MPQLAHWYVSCVLIISIFMVQCNSKHCLV